MKDRMSRTSALLAPLYLIAPLALATVSSDAGGAPARAKGGSAASPAAARPCFTPQAEPIPAQKILQDLMDGKDVSLQGRIIEGSLDADLAWPASDGRRVSMRLVRGRLWLESCRITGRVSLPRCVLAQPISLSCTEVLGDVDLTDSLLRGGLVADRGHILGAVRVGRAVVEGDISLKGAIVEGDIDAVGATLQGLSFGEAELRRNVDLSGAITGGIDLSSAKVIGSMKLEDTLVLGSFAAGEASFARGLRIESARVNGPLMLNAATGPGDFYLSGLTVDGHLMAPLERQPALTLNDVKVGQNLILIDGQYKDVLISGLKVQGGSDLVGARFAGKVVIRDTDFGKVFNATEALFERDVEFRKVVFPGNDPMEGIYFSRAPLIIETTLPAPPRVSAPEDDDTTEHD